MGVAGADVWGCCPRVLITRKTIADFKKGSVMIREVVGRASDKSTVQLGIVDANFLVVAPGYPSLGNADDLQAYFLEP